MDKDWQDAWEKPEEIEAAKKRALLRGIHQRIDQGRRSRRLFIIGTSSAAAAVVIALFVKFAGAPIPESKWLELASNETSRKITLDDSSVVWLAPHSVVRVDPGFSQRRETALIKGVAFFSIAKDERHQFSIAVNQQRVTVLGTAFTLHKLDSVDIQLLVKEGKVALDNPGGRQLLTAGHQVNTTRAITGTLQHIDPDEADWWLQKQVRWHNVSLENLIHHLEDYYQTKLTHGAIDKEMKVTLTWDMSVSMAENLTVLNSLTGYNIH